MKTHSELAEFRARRRNPRFAFPEPRDEPSWMQPQEDSSLVRLVVVGLAIALGVLLCLAFWARVAADLRNDSFAKERVDECIAEGGTPHVDRAKDDSVIDVRCGSTSGLSEPYKDASGEWRCAPGKMCRVPDEVAK